MAAKAFSILSLALAAAASPTPSVDNALSSSEPAVSARPVERRQEKAAKGGKGGGGLAGLLGGGAGALSMGSSSDMKGAYTCKYAAFMCARGTGEPGNMGFVACPPLGAALRKTYGQDMLIQGIDYTTNFAGGGAKEFVRLTKALMQKCPETKIVWSGYSQGAMQVHEGLTQLGNDAGKIHAAVTFGDPYSSAGWSSPLAGFMPGGGGMKGKGGGGKTGGKGGASAPAATDGKASKGPASSPAATDGKASKGPASAPAASEGKLSKGRPSPPAASKPSDKPSEAPSDATSGDARTILNVLDDLLAKRGEARNELARRSSSEALITNEANDVQNLLDALDEPAEGAAPSKGAKGAKTASKGSSSSKESTSSGGAAEVGPGPFKAKNGLIICSPGDFVCGLVPGGGGKKDGNGVQKGGGGGGGHLSYSSDGSIPKAHDFIVEKIGRAKKA